MHAYPLVSSVTGACDDPVQQGFWSLGLCGAMLQSDFCCCRRSARLPEHAVQEKYTVAVGKEMDGKVISSSLASNVAIAVVLLGVGVFLRDDGSSDEVAFLATVVVAGRR